jgi:hypothetical protein
MADAVPVTIQEQLKSQRELLARLQSIGQKNYIGYFDKDGLFHGVRTNNIDVYISQRLRGKELRMQVPKEQSTVIYFDDEDIIKFDDCIARLERAVKIQANYALADVFDNQMGENSNCERQA